MVVSGRGAPLRPDRIFAWNCWWFVGSSLFAWSRRHNNFEPVRFDQHRTYLLALEPSDIGLFAWARGHVFGCMGASSVRGRSFTIASLNLGLLIERSERPSIAWLGWSAAVALVALVSGIGALHAGIRTPLFCVLSHARYILFTCAICNLLVRPRH